MTRLNSSEYDKYRQDIENYPNAEYSGTYKNRKWVIRRGHGHLSGYLYDLTNEEITKMEWKIHGGITCSDNNFIGFDCFDSGDYFNGYLVDVFLKNNPEMDVEFYKNSPGTYKNYEWVLNHIKELFDEI